MNRKSIIRLQTFFLLALLVGPNKSHSQIVSGLAGEPTRKSHPIEILVTEDVVGVAAIDLTKLSAKPATKLIQELGVLVPEELKTFRQSVDSEFAAIKKLQAAGIEKAYCLFRADDVSAQSTCFVVPYQGDQAKQLIDTLKIYLQSRWKFSGLKHQVEPSFIVLSQSQERIESLFKGSARKDVNKIAQALDRLDSTALGITFFGNSDTRRVLRELVPALQPPFDGLNGRILADQTERISLTADLSPTANMSLRIDTDSSETAATMRRLLKTGISKLLATEEMKATIPPAAGPIIARFLEPTVDGNTVTVSLKQMISESKKLGQLLGPLLRSGRQKLASADHDTNLRQIALGILNYESAHRHFPLQATKSPADKPLLSWRVAILPYVEQNELYSQFKLDQPWDSEHNLKLAKQMPAIYRDSSADGFENNRAGRTVFQTPWGAGTILDGEEPVKFSDVTDGSSNTILVVTTAPTSAVPWTKPVDWNVNFEKPFLGLLDEKRTTAGYCRVDGSTGTFNNKTDPKNLIHLLQRADGNVVVEP